LSEGFASYYQNVLRARAGVLVPEAAWRELAAGLARGAKAAKPGQTVEQGGRMVTYWTGAALALEWDLALRQASGGKQSLDTLLTRFAAKELPARAPWGASEVAAALDRASNGVLGKDHFSASMSRALSQRGFPDYLASFALAGIDPATGKASPGTPVMYLALMRPPRSD
jgi:predicted metalloprotease with PDZ domain